MQLIMGTIKVGELAISLTFVVIFSSLFPVHQSGMWTINPIDRTKGFLCGKQYAICLSLIVDLIVQVGIIGCPNLLVNPQNSEQGTCCLFVTVHGQVTKQVSCNHSPSLHLAQTC